MILINGECKLKVTVNMQRINIKKIKNEINICNVMLNPILQENPILLHLLQNIENLKNYKIYKLMNIFNYAKMQKMFIFILKNRFKKKKNS